MKVEQFISEIKANTPSINDYLNQGYSEKLATETVKSFVITEKKYLSKFQDELLKFVDGFEARSLEIGIVKFHEYVQIETDYYIVGEVEADWLVIDKITQLVKVIELYSGTDLWLCAIDGSMFLDAILQVKKFITKTSLDENWKDEQRILCSFSNECGHMAGGERFIEFYKMLLGCFE